MKKSTKADMGIRRRLYKLLRNGPQRRDRAVEGLEYGIVGVSEGITSTGIVPFDGMKEAASAHLVVHWGSKYGIEEFLEVKYLCMGGIDR